MRFSFQLPLYSLCGWPEPEASQAITADTALRLAAHFGTAAETWLNLQSEYDLRVTRRKVGEEIARTVRKREAA